MKSAVNFVEAGEESARFGALIDPVEIPTNLFTPRTPSFDSRMHIIPGDTRYIWHTLLPFVAIVTRRTCQDGARYKVK